MWLLSSLYQQFCLAVRTLPGNYFSVNWCSVPPHSRRELENRSQRELFTPVLAGGSTPARCSRARGWLSASRVSTPGSLRFHAALCGAGSLGRLLCSPETFPSAPAAAAKETRRPLCACEKLQSAMCGDKDPDGRNGTGTETEPPVSAPSRRIAPRRSDPVGLQIWSSPFLSGGNLQEFQVSGENLNTLGWNFLVLS